MYTTYHLSSAQEVNSDILDAIKLAFKSRPITITIEEEDQDFEISQELKNLLDERLLEDESDYMSADESIKQLKEKFGL
jgi:D-Tyr-tRNAtyr deacylase